VHLDAARHDAYGWGMPIPAPPAGPSSTTAQASPVPGLRRSPFGFSGPWSDGYPPPGVTDPGEAQPPAQPAPEKRTAGIDASFLGAIFGAGVGFVVGGAVGYWGGKPRPE